MATGTVLNEGKTKIIWAAPEKGRGMVRIENKIKITKNDNPDETREFETKARCSTVTTSRVFELLKAGGIPVAFERQLSDTEFLAKDCKMLPLEAVARRYGVGSYLKRHPELAHHLPPHRFHKLVTEFFLKTTRGQLVIDGAILVNGLNPSAGEEDPLILDVYDDEWSLVHSKKPAWETSSDLDRKLPAARVLGSDYTKLIEQMDQILRKTFLLLEGAWNTLGLRLIDFKIEFGIDEDGNLLVADVIDNDSWRLRTQEWEELSKQAFRDCEPMSQVERKYLQVTGLVEHFRLPKQALVIWTGSKSDEFSFEGFPNNVGVDLVATAESGHKKPRTSCNNVEDFLTEYPDGGVIIAKVGRSNGLGPMLAARTVWTVIAVPANYEKFPEDIHSSLRLPSDVPLLVTWPEKNALLAAMNILAQKNPILYMQRQLLIEEFDE